MPAPRAPQQADFVRGCYSKRTSTSGSQKQAGCEGSYGLVIDVPHSSKSSIASHAATSAAGDLRASSSQIVSTSAGGESQAFSDETDEGQRCILDVTRDASRANQGKPMRVYLEGR